MIEINNTCRIKLVLNGKVICAVGYCQIETKRAKTQFGMNGPVNDLGNIGDVSIDITGQFDLDFEEFIGSLPPCGPHME